MVSLYNPMSCLDRGVPSFVWKVKRAVWRIISASSTQVFLCYRKSTPLSNVRCLGSCDVFVPWAACPLSHICALYSLLIGRRLFEWLSSTSSSSMTGALVEEELSEDQQQQLQQLQQEQQGGSGPLSPAPSLEVRSAALRLCSSLLDIGVLCPLEDETGKEKFKVSRSLLVCLSVCLSICD